MCAPPSPTYASTLRPRHRRLSRPSFSTNSRLLLTNLKCPREFYLHVPLHASMARRTRSSRGGTSGASKSSIGVTPFRVDAQAKIRRLCEVRTDEQYNAVWEDSRRCSTNNPTPQPPTPHQGLSHRHTPAALDCRTQVFNRLLSTNKPAPPLARTDRRFGIAPG